MGPKKITVDKRRTHRAWCFTWYPKAVSEDVYPEPPFSEDVMKYLVYQGEITKKEKFHWQGYVEFKNAVRWNTVQNLLPQGAWFTKRDGQPDEARDYCMKEESRIIAPKEFGTFSNEQQGCRTDLKLAAKKISEGKWLEVDPVVVIKYGKGLERLAEWHNYRRKDEIVRNWKTEVTVIHDSSGKGKTKIAEELIGGVDCYRLSFGNSGNVWWTGYQGHENVIINDYHGQIPFDTFLNVIDRYPWHVMVHGSQRQLLAKRIIITSTSSPEHWYTADKYAARYDELKRRIDKIITVKDLEAEKEERERAAELLAELYA